MTPTTAKIPLHFSSDRDCLRAAIRFSGTEAESAGIVRVRSTLALDRFVASENYVSQIADRGDLSIVSDPVAWEFDGAGDFDTANDLLASGAKAASSSHV
jgi:hypothetical protein